MAKLTRETKDGIYSLMLTPFFEDRTIDYNTYEEYADWQVAQGVDHLFAVCGSSEMKELTLEERLKLATLTVKHKGETTVVATANIEATKEENLEEIKKMEQTGVDGLVLTTKGYGDDDDKLVEYIRGTLTRSLSLISCPPAMVSAANCSTLSSIPCSA